LAGEKPARSPARRVTRAHVARAGRAGFFTGQQTSTSNRSSDGIRTATLAAIAGDSIGINLTEQIFVERGYVASHQNETPIETNRFHAIFFGSAREPMRVGRLYDLRLATAGA